MAVLPVRKELIEKMDPKLPTAVVRTEDNQEKFLIIEWEELVTLPNLLGGVSDIDMCGGLFCYVICIKIEGHACVYNVITLSCLIFVLTKRSDRFYKLFILF